jgi:hypothetical protein
VFVDVTRVTDVRASAGFAIELVMEPMFGRGPTSIFLVANPAVDRARWMAALQSRVQLSRLRLDCLRRGGRASDQSGQSRACASILAAAQPRIEKAARALKSAVNSGAKCIVWVDKVENHEMRDHADLVRLVERESPDTQIIFVGRPEELQAALEMAGYKNAQGASPCTVRVITRSELWHCTCCLLHNIAASPAVTISQIAP